MSSYHFLLVPLMMSSIVSAQPRVLTIKHQGQPTLNRFAEDDPRAWKEITSDAGRFSVLMPGQPQQTVQEFGGKNPAHMTKLKTTAAVYMVWYRDYPLVVTDPERIKLLLTFTRDYTLQGTKGKLLAEADITLGDIIGHESTMEMPEGLIWKLRGYLVGKRFYQVSIWISAEDYPKRKD